jgi:serine/threonine protein phosphatase PrpC
MIVDSLRRTDREAADGAHPSAVLDDVEDILLAVNSRLYAKARESDPPTVIGSTVVALLGFPMHGILLWAGDSRAYRLRDGEFRQLTRDHSEVQDLVTRGELRPEEAETHASANVITRAVGGTSDLYVDVTVAALADGDRYLLCSDGLYKELDEATMAVRLGTGPVDEACDGLVAAALEKAGGDNVTVIVVEFRHQEPAPDEHGADSGDA